MNIFSGRPNPTWALPPRKTKELVDRLSAEGPLVAPHQSPTLGFRGFTLDADLEDLAVNPIVPAHFVVPPPAVREPVEPPQAKAKRRAAETVAVDEQKVAVAQDISQFLLSTAPDHVAIEALEAVDQSIRHGSIAAEPAEAKARDGRRKEMRAEERLVDPPLANPACEPFLTPLQEAFWNHPFRRFGNNCYNFASNFASNTMAQPGRHSGRMYTAFECGNVLAAAKADGYRQECDGTLRVVALAIWPRIDFHWWRLHPGGFWAHKIGTSMVMQVDNLGRILGNGLTPANCDRGPYSMFCGFFFGPLGVEVI